MNRRSAGFFVSVHRIYSSSSWNYLTFTDLDSQTSIIIIISNIHYWMTAGGWYLLYSYLIMRWEWMRLWCSTLAFTQYDYGHLVVVGTPFVSNLNGVAHSKHSRQRRRTFDQPNPAPLTPYPFYILQFDSITHIACLHQQKTDVRTPLLFQRKVKRVRTCSLLGE